MGKVKDDAGELQNEGKHDKTLHSNLLEENLEADVMNEIERDSENLTFVETLRGICKFKNPFSTDKPHNGRGGTIFLILNTMIGSGILNQPQVFADAGIISSLIMFAIATYAVWLGLQLLIEVGIAKKTYGYTEVMNVGFGRKGDLCVDWCIVIGNFGALLSYFTVIAGELSDVLENLTGEEDKWYTEAVFLLPIVTVLFVLPTCLQRYYGHFVMISIFSIFAITVVMIVVIVCGPIEGKANRSEEIVLFDVGGTLSKFGSTMFALGCAYAAFHAFESMKHPTQKAWWDAMTPAVILGSLMCITTGLAGYLSFRDGTSGDILDNFDSSDYDFVKILVVIHLLLYIPLDFVVARHSFCKIIQKDLEKMHLLPYILLTVSMLAVTCVCVMILYGAGIAEGDSFGYILDFTGAITVTAISFIFPGGLYLKLMPKESENWYQAMGLLIFGCVVCIASPAATIVEAIQEYS